MQAKDGSVMRYLKLFLLPIMLLLAACGASFGPEGPPLGTRDEVAALERGILALGPDIDPAEAARAAEIAYAYTRVLADEYEISDPPLVHNTKVNMGIRPRGLCWHWAEDIETRLNGEDFETLTLHRAIANSDNPFRIDHSTAIVSAKGETFDEGIVLDPWRFGGFLFWSPVKEDADYIWIERSLVLERKRELLLRRYGEAVL
ncbi:MAG: hypothetical protein AAF871_07050 [Pseudomonadota bacterium]